MNKNKYLAWVTGVGLLASLTVALPVFAQTASSTQNWHGGGHGGMRGGSGTSGMMAPGVFGTVSAVNGTTLTVTSKRATSTVYTVDASSAQVVKDGASSTIASVATGDMVMAQGTVTGTNVAATVIRDGMGGPMMGGRGFGKGGPGGMASSTSHTAPVSPIKGNGEPVVAGSITAVSGTTLTITNASNVTYTIDASSATIVKNGTTTAFSDLVTGDNVVVQGTVNGTAVAASSVLDQGVASSATSARPAGGGGFGGFFGSIGSFFKHIFGF